MSLSTFPTFFNATGEHQTRRLEWFLETVVSMEQIAISAVVPEVVAVLVAEPEAVMEDQLVEEQADQAVMDHQVVTAMVHQAVTAMVHRAAVSEELQLRIGSIDPLIFMAVIILIFKPCLVKNAEVAVQWRI